MINKWKETTLGENLLEIAMGPFGSNLKVETFTEDGIPVIRGGNLDENYVAGDFVYVSEEKANSLNRSVAYPGDFVVTHRGTLGQVSIVPCGSFPKYVVSQSQLRFRVDPKKLYKEYLLYYLKSRYGQFELLKSASQVGVPSIARPTAAIKEIKLPLPTLSEQKAIAAVLSSYDGKIELLRRQNKTLEAIAQTIFKEWFVNFKIKGQKLKIKKETGLPEGWKMGRLGDAVDIIDGDRGVNYPKNHEFLKEGYCLFLSTNNVPNESFSFDDNMFITKEKDSMLRKGKLKRDDFVLTTRGTVGNYAFYYKQVPFENIRLNSGMVILRTRDEVISKVIFYYYLKSPCFRNQILSLSSGSAQPQLPIRDLSIFEILLPPKDVLEKYNSAIQPSFNKINNNYHQIQTLSKLRDLLLPKLMRGEIRVNM